NDKYQTSSYNDKYQTSSYYDKPQTSSYKDKYQTSSYKDKYQTYSYNDKYYDPSYNKPKESKGFSFSNLFKRSKKGKKSKKTEEPPTAKITIDYLKESMSQASSNNTEHARPVVVTLQNVTFHLDQENSQHSSFLECIQKAMEEQNSNNQPRQ
ncbi:hypothetical protein PCHDS_000523000, partial [Plasmodium chabaudi adami]